MKYQEITINQLFEKNKNPQRHFSEIQKQEKIGTIKKSVKKKEPRLKWQLLWGEISTTSAELLNIKLSDILEKSWSKYEEVEKFLKIENNPDETFFVPLLEHTIVSEHHPKIEIWLGEQKLGDIDFELMLRLRLKAIILKIKNGKIIGVKTGKCSTTGNFSCEGISLFEDETAEFEF